VLIALVVSIAAPARAGDLLPAAYHHALTADEAADLAAFVNAWIAQTDDRPQSPPSIEYRRGVVFVENEEDRADDGPYPRSAGREAERVCGTASTWLRAALLDELRGRDVTCAGNVCTYAGQEYAPSGYLVFRPIAGAGGSRAWALEAWVQVYEVFGGGADDSVAFVTSSLRRLARTRCPGEPAGAY
jgi:hypothetical protein